MSKRTTPNFTTFVSESLYSKGVIFELNRELDEYLLRADAVFSRLIELDLLAVYTDTSTPTFNFNIESRAHKLLNEFFNKFGYKIFPICGLSSNKQTLSFEIDQIHTITTGTFKRVSHFGCVYLVNPKNIEDLVEILKNITLSRISVTFDFDINELVNLIKHIADQENITYKTGLFLAPNALIKNVLVLLKDYYLHKLKDEIFKLDFNFDQEIISIGLKSLIEFMTPSNIMNYIDRVDDNFIEKIKTVLSQKQFNQILPVLNIKKLGL